MDVEQNRSFFNSKAEYWDSITNHDPQIIKLLLDLLDLKQGAAVLDVGTGTGVLIPFLLELTGSDCRITAIDLAENMINKARSKFPSGNIEYLCGDIAEYPLLVDFYDAAVCYSVFPHFVEPARILIKLASLLKPSGRLLVGHSESRDVINARHRQLGKSLISRGLPPSDQVANMMEQAGLVVTGQADADTLYYVLGKKP